MENTSNFKKNELHFKEAFELADIDKNGEIGVNEVISALRSLDLEISADTIKQFVEENSGKIDFDGFYNLIEKDNFSDLTQEEQEVIKAFKTFDKNGSGSISCNEFKHILCSIGDKLSESEVDEIFKEADLNHDGQLDYREFVKFWSSK